jgi:diaminopimelate epimerase
MKISFSKYQGTGNDFILIDNRNNIFPKEDLNQIIFLCDRKFGIGSDGLILIEKSNFADFEMIFFNPDGSKSLCGNGSRCAVRYAFELKMIGLNCTFLAYDGMHQASFTENLIRVEMRNVAAIEDYADFLFLNTGSPHVVVFKSDIEALNVLEEGRKIRYDKRFESIGGTNVNFVSILNNEIHIRTYERGVEDETLSCGTGVTAAALAYSLKNMTRDNYTVVTRGGNLKVAFTNLGNGSFANINLSGPAEFIFDGNIEI